MKAGYHNIKNGKYSLAEIVKIIAYAKAISLDPQIAEATQYANGKLVAKITSDSGYNGSLGVTAQDPELEKDIGRSIKMADGSLTVVGGANPIRLTGLYYEFNEEEENGKRSTVTVWLHNVEIGASSFNHATDSNNVDFGEYSYPITVYGSPLLTANGEEYVDKNGVGRTCFMSICRPDDIGYAEFGKAVPALIIATETAAQSETETAAQSETETEA